MRHIFEGRGKSGHMIRSTINDAIKAIGFAPATCHGFRSLLFSWGVDEGYSREVKNIQARARDRQRSRASVYAQPDVGDARACSNTGVT